MRVVALLVAALAVAVLVTGCGKDTRPAASTGAATVTLTEPASGPTRDR